MFKEISAFSYARSCIINLRSQLAQVLDECHHAHDLHPYNQILKHYKEQEATGQARTQVITLLFVQQMQHHCFLAFLAASDSQACCVIATDEWLRSSLFSVNLAFVNAVYLALYATQCTFTLSISTLCQSRSHCEAIMSCRFWG